LEVIEPGRQVLGQESPQRILPTHRLGPEDRRDRRRPLNVGIGELDYPLRVAAGEGLEPLPDQLDVLLRHRLRLDPGVASEHDLGVFP
jgi:hypothetical protein